MTTTCDVTRIEALPDELLAELAYVARRDRKAHPRGRADNGGRWYPDTDAEGGEPPCRTPSRAYPWSYMLGCRTRAWCAQLPRPTLLADASLAVDAVLAGDVDLADRANARLRRLLAQAKL